jgi:hypothetical protein
MVDDLPFASLEPNTRRQQIAEILHHLAIAYYNTQTERQRLGRQLSYHPSRPSVLEEIEELTVSIRTFGTQIQVRGSLREEEQAISELKDLRVFNVPQVAKLYFGPRENYQSIRAYLQMLDYLRLVILEYLMFDH